MNDLDKILKAIRGRSGSIKVLELPSNLSAPENFDALAKIAEAIRDNSILNAKFKISENWYSTPLEVQNWDNGEVYRITYNDYDNIETINVPLYTAEQFEVLKKLRICEDMAPANPTNWLSINSEYIQFDGCYIADEARPGWMLHLDESGNFEWIHGDYEASFIDIDATMIEDFKKFKGAYIEGYSWPE